MRVVESVVLTWDRVSMMPLLPGRALTKHRATGLDSWCLQSATGERTHAEQVVGDKPDTDHGHHRDPAATALANGRGSELVDVLAQGERHVDELAAAISQSVANTSFRLRTLTGAGLVVTRRDRTRVCHRLSSDRVIDLWRVMRDVAAAHHDRIDALAVAYLGHREELDQISRNELSERIAVGDVIVLDVRPTAEYASGHITGARSVPAERLARELRDQQSAYGLMTDETHRRFGLVLDCADPEGNEFCVCDGGHPAPTAATGAGR